MKESPDPILDITRYELPLEINSIFDNPNKTALEIGFGEGEFIEETASIYKDWNFIGIEIKYGRFKKAVRKINKSSLNNVRLIHIDATIAVEQVFGDSSFDKVYINFPDPWPKDKHKKHRMINETFLNNLMKIMKEKSLLEFVSDHEDYVGHTLEVFKKVKDFKQTNLQKGNKINTGNRPITKFESEFLEKNKDIYYLTFEKRILDDN